MHSSTRSPSSPYGQVLYHAWKLGSEGPALWGVITASWTFGEGFCCLKVLVGCMLFWPAAEGNTGAQSWRPFRTQAKCFDSQNWPWAVKLEKRYLVGGVEHWHPDWSLYLYLSLSQAWDIS